MLTRQTILDYVQPKYQTSPETPWKKFPLFTVLRHSHNRKWYGLIMNVSKQKLQLANNNNEGDNNNSDENVDIINVKIDPELSIALQGQKGILPAYHMSKKHWITIILDGSVADKEIINLIDASYELTT